MTRDIPRTFIINLRRRPDRLEAALKQCEAVGIFPEVFEAYDGSRLPLPKRFKDGPGAYGCSLSHQALLRKCIMEDVPKALILEDDVTFTDDFTERYQTFREHCPADWSSLMLGGEHLRPATLVNEKVVRCNFTARTHAYLITRAYMPVLLSHWQEEPHHVDYVWRMHMNDQGVNVYAPSRWLCGQAEGTSDITRQLTGQRYWQKGEKEKGCKTCAEKARERQRERFEKARQRRHERQARSDQLKQ